MSSTALWWLTRGTGVVSLVLLTVVVVLGVLSRGGVPLGRLPRFVTPALHRNVSLMSVAFLGVHIATAVADPYAPIRIVDAVVPFTSAYRPLWLGLGALALDLLVAVVVTSLLRRRLGHRAWRAVHWLGYAAWPVAVVHALGTGSDVHRPWLLWTVAGSVMAVVGAAVWRLLGGGRARHRPGLGSHPRRRPVAVAVMLAAPLALAGWTMQGPLAVGWAARSGTPTGLLHSATSSTATTQTSSAGVAGTAVLAGSLSQRVLGDDEITVVIDGRLSSASTAALNGGSVQVLLTGRPLDDGGGVSLTGGAVTLRTPAASYQGPVTSLSGGRIAAAVSGSAGHLQVVADVRVNGSTTTGTVTVA